MWTVYKNKERIQKFRETGNSRCVYQNELDKACGQFTKNKERIQKFKETGDSRYVYQNELDKACFEHDMAYGDFKDLTRRIVSA